MSLSEIEPYKLPVGQFYISCSITPGWKNIPSMSPPSLAKLPHFFSAHVACCELTQMDGKYTHAGTQCTCWVGNSIERETEGNITITSARCITSWYIVISLHGVREVTGRGCMCLRFADCEKYTVICFTLSYMFVVPLPPLPLEWGSEIKIEIEYHFTLKKRRDNSRSPKIGTTGKNLPAISWLLSRKPGRVRER